MKSGGLEELTEGHVRTFKVVQLKRELRIRGLKTNGRKAELVKRLIQALKVNLKPQEDIRAQQQQTEKREKDNFGANEAPWECARKVCRFFEQSTNQDFQRVNANVIAVVAKRSVSKFFDELIAHFFEILEIFETSNNISSDNIDKIILFVDVLIRSFSLRLDAPWTILSEMTSLFLYAFVDNELIKPEVKAFPVVETFLSQMKVKLKSVNSQVLKRVACLPNLLNFVNTLCTGRFQESIADEKMRSLTRKTIELIQLVLMHPKFRRYSVLLIKSSNVLAYLLLRLGQIEEVEHDLVGLEHCHYLLHYSRNVHLDKLMADEVVYDEHVKRVKKVLVELDDSTDDLVFKEMAKLSPTAFYDSISTFEKFEAVFKKLDLMSLESIVKNVGLFTEQPNVLSLNQGFSTYFCNPTVPEKYLQQFLLALVFIYLRKPHSNDTRSRFPTEHSVDIESTAVSMPAANFINNVSIKNSLSLIRSSLRACISKWVTDSKMSLENLICSGFSNECVPIESSRVVSTLQDNFSVETRAVVIEVQFYVDYSSKPSADWDNLSKSDSVVLLKATIDDNGEVTLTRVRFALLYQRALRIPPDTRQKRAIRLLLEPEQFDADPESFYTFDFSNAKSGSEGVIMVQGDKFLSGKLQELVVCSNLMTYSKTSFAQSEYNIQEFNKSELNPNYGIHFTSESTLSTNKIVLKRQLNGVNTVNLEQKFSSSVRMIFDGLCRLPSGIEKVADPSNVVHAIKNDFVNLIALADVKHQYQLLESLSMNGGNDRLLIITSTRSLAEKFTVDLVESDINTKDPFCSGTVGRIMVPSEKKIPELYTLDERLEFLNCKRTVFLQFAENLINCFDGKAIEKFVDIYNVNGYPAVAKDINTEELFITCSTAVQDIESRILPSIGSSLETNNRIQRLLSTFQLQLNAFRDMLDSVVQELKRLLPFELLRSKVLRRQYMFLKYSRVLIVHYETFLSLIISEEYKLNDYVNFQQIAICDDGVLNLISGMMALLASSKMSKRACISVLGLSGNRNPECFFSHLFQTPANCRKIQVESDAKTRDKFIPLEKDSQFISTKNHKEQLRFICYFWILLLVLGVPSNLIIVFADSTDVKRRLSRMLLKVSRRLRLLAKLPKIYEKPVSTMFFDTKICLCYGSKHGKWATFFKDVNSGILSGLYFFASEPFLSTIENHLSKKDKLAYKQSVERQFRLQLAFNKDKKLLIDSSFELEETINVIIK